MGPRPFEFLVHEHGAVVMRVVRALLGPADAEDAWSETFLAALKAYPDLEPGSNERGWLVTIAHRKAIDQLRATSRRAIPSAELPEDPAVDEHTTERDTDLWSALARLPFKQRAAVAYHHIAGLPYTEVGELIDSTGVAARRSAADGISKLRAIYGKARV